MINQKVQEALNQQLNLEFHSFYSYLAMSAYCDDKNLKGFARWMRMQSQEELGHALKIYDYMLQRNGIVQLLAIDGMRTDWPSLLSVFQDAYAQETKVTTSIDNLVTLSHEEHDHATVSFLQWFVDEQVEELALVDEVLQNVKLVGDNGAALFLLDRELGQRREESAGEGDSN